MTLKTMSINLEQIIELISPLELERALEKADMGDEEWENTLEKLKELQNS